jgi:hypothetical protein
VQSWTATSSTIQAMHATSTCSERPALREVSVARPPALPGSGMRGRGSRLAPTRSEVEICCASSALLFRDAYAQARVWTRERARTAPRRKRLVKVCASDCASALHTCRVPAGASVIQTAPALGPSAFVGHGCLPCMCSRVSRGASSDGRGTGRRTLAGPSSFHSSSSTVRPCHPHSQSSSALIYLNEAGRNRP